MKILRSISLLIFVAALFLALVHETQAKREHPRLLARALRFTHGALLAGTSQRRRIERTREGGRSQN